MSGVRFAYVAAASILAAAAAYALVSGQWWAWVVACALLGWTVQRSRAR
jgi:hypothetical protein